MKIGRIPSSVENLKVELVDSLCQCKLLTIWGISCFSLKITAIPCFYCSDADFKIPANVMIHLISA